jgi:hypothetical protein
MSVYSPEFGDLDIAEAGAWRRKRGLGETDLGQTCNLLGPYAEDVRSDIAEVYLGYRAVGDESDSVAGVVSETS